MYIKGVTVHWTVGLGAYLQGIF